MFPNMNMGMGANFTQNPNSSNLTANTGFSQTSMNTQQIGGTQTANTSVNMMGINMADVDMKATENSGSAKVNMMGIPI